MTAPEQGHRDLIASIGKAIHMRRVELDLSRAELAEAAGLSYAYVSEIENGTKQASSKALWRLAQALELQPHELMASAARLEPAGSQALASRAPFWSGGALRFSLAPEESTPDRRWFHGALDTVRADAPTAPAEEPGGRPELTEVLERIGAALEGVADERAELALMLALDERRTRRIVREELDRRERRPPV